MKRVRNFPFHIFLIPVFFIWHILNAHFGLISFHYWAPFFLYYIILATLFLIAGLLIFKNSIKAGCWCSANLIIFFFFGAAHDSIRKFPLPSFFASYTFLLPLAAVLIIGYLILLKKRTTPYKTNRYLSILFLSLTAIELMVSLFKASSHHRIKNNLAWNEPPVSINYKTTEPLPDIFFIVFDEYASTPALKKYLSYDNSSIDSLLKKNNFFIASNAQSNYDLTPLSVASTFHMKYFAVPLEGVKPTLADNLKYQTTLTQSPLPEILRNHGYQIINAGISHFKNTPLSHEPYFNRFIPHAFYGETIAGRISKEIGWHFPMINFQFFDPAETAEKGKQRNLEKFDILIKELKQESLKPRFVYCHLMLPHAPYFVNRNGETRSFTEFDISQYNDSLYIDQLLYANTFIDSIAKTTNKEFIRPRIVIVEGDHGKRKLNLPSHLIVRDRQFMNLSSYYFSDGDYSQLYDSISPVNTFRIVLNKYFNAHLPIFKDSTILLLQQ